MDWRVLKIIKLLACAACAVALLTGCGRRDDIIQDFGPEGFYDRGFEAMDSGNYIGAIAYFQQLEARYPFSNLTRQAQLDLIYLYDRSRQPEAAIDAAEEFERENPTHPRVDYCIYMKGRVYFDQSPNILERVFNVDMSVRPPKDTLASFAAFQELLRRFPDSRYADDARQRMVYLRNRLTAYENHVARYYLQRGAHVAAINRTMYALEHYPGSPGLVDTLALMIEAYDQLGMVDLAVDAERVLMETFGEPAQPIRLE